MLYVSFFVTIVALVLIFIGLRGRRSVRGVYCRGCRFDLCGTDLKSDEPRCPECGADLTSPRSHAETVRNKRHGAMWAGALTLPIGAILLAVSFMGGFGAIYTNLPMNSLLTLTEWGDDEALDELVRRIGLPESVLTERHWDRVIEHGLKLQAHEAVEWDWRWGELLSVALTTNQMSQEEIGQYFLNGLAPELTVRTKAHPGVQGIPNRLDLTQNRMWAINYKPTNFSVTCQLIAFGEVGIEPVMKLEVQEYSRPFNISATPDQQTGGSFGGPGGMNHRIQCAPGDTARVYFDYVVRVQLLKDETLILDTTVREEFDIEFVDPEEPLVATVHDDALVQSLGREMWCSVIQVPAQFPEPNQFGMYNVLLGMVHSPSIREHLALRFYIELDGEEIEVGKRVIQASTPYDHGAHLWARTRPSNESEVERLRALHQRLLEASEARVIARSDPVLAAEEPDANEILGVEIIFDDVPITIREQIPAYYSEMPDSVTATRPTSFRSVGEDDIDSSTIGEESP